MSIIQICAAAVAGMLLAVQFKAQKPEYGIYISIVLSLLIFFSVLEKIETIAEVIRKIGTYISVDDMYMGTLFKMLGITYVAEFASNICKDAGYQTIARQIEIFGKLAIMVLSFPVLLAILDTIRKVLT